MPQLRSARKNNHIYKEIASAMTAAGHTYTAVEIKVKIHNFTNKYRIEKRKIGPSGGSASKWTHFAAVHQAISGNKSFCSAELVEDSIMDIYVDDIYKIEPIHVESEIEEESPLASPGASSDTSNRSSSSDAEENKRKTAVSVMEEMREDFLMAIQAMKDADEKRLRLFEQFANDVREMKDAFIDFVRRQN